MSRFLTEVENPVGCKLGPAASAEEVVRLCGVLDPDRVPGRLTLVPRMGAVLVGEVHPPILRAVRDSGHPVAWGATRGTPTP